MSTSRSFPSFPKESLFHFRQYNYSSSILILLYEKRKPEITKGLISINVDYFLRFCATKQRIHHCRRVSAARQLFMHVGITRCPMIGHCV